MSHLGDRNVMVVSPKARVALLAGSDVDHLVAGALETTPPPPEPVLVATARSTTADDAGQTVTRALTASGRRVRLLAPPTSTAGAWVRSRTTEWREVDVSLASSRLARVALPSSLVQATTIVAVNGISADASVRDPIAIGIWARFAHPRQRLGARLSDPRDGLTAEIALAVRPALILLFARWNDRPMLIVSHDQIAAELAGRAVRQRLSDTADEPIGPWEHPLVQHATELGLGVATPAEIDAEIRWLGEPQSEAGAAFRSFAAEILGRIGVVPAD